MAKQLPTLDIENTEEKVSFLLKENSRIQNGFVEIGLDYANKVTGKFFSKDNDRYFQLRDSIFYRLNSILFHLQLLLSVQKNQLKQLNTRPINQGNRHAILMRTESQFYVFDSIVFHAISLFDYLGNLIDYVCVGKGQMRLKWNGVVKSVYDKNNPLSSSPIVGAVKKLHSELIDKLYEHRSRLIHYETDKGGAQTSLSLKDLRSTLVVFAPKRIVESFPELSKMSETNRLSLNYVSFWLCEQTLNGTAELISPILGHMLQNRKTTKDQEIFLDAPKIPPNNENK